jgi:hypothetical protein
MGTSQPRFVIGEKEVAEISSYCRIAKANSSRLTVTELLQLTTADATEEDLLGAWDENATLSSMYQVESGYIVERGEGRGGGAASQTEADVEERNRARARVNISAARELARICADDRVRLLAVSGGNSYKSARDGDDIDFFCVTTENSLWPFMLKSLLIARLYQLTRRSAPFCFSYVMDEDRALREFAETGDGLFARDALAAEVLVGRGFYRSLLLEATWMQSFFPRMYHRGLSATEGGRDRQGKRGSRTLNAFLYYTVGGYVRMKAYLLNRKYRSRGNVASVFRVRIGTDHCVYESNRYQRLRTMYGSREADGEV